MNSRALFLLAGIAASASFATNAQAAFVINLDFVDGTSPAAVTAFNNALNTWSSIITGYKSGVSLDGLTISCGTQNIDGPGRVLAQTGVTDAAWVKGTVYSTSAEIIFDSSDFSRYTTQQATDIVTHEMGHALGIGTEWISNNLYAAGTGQYYGSNGLAAYRAEFDPTADFVPVELGGGAGTADAHWDEVNGGSDLTGIVSKYNGEDFAFELMTGWYNSPAYLSSLTRYSMVDLGYTVNPVPEPAAYGAIIATAVVMVPRRRRAR